ncbi:MAG: endolytic transglycosylase MltG [Novosphingobium aromaticivorans]|nr:endolytic transglycosylase MltG [Novosphingobium aromaticivorans]
MIARIGPVRLAILGALLLMLGWGAHFFWGWYGPGPLDKEASFVVPDGASVGSIAGKLEAEGAIASASTFRARARLLGAKDPIKAGEFSLPAHASGSTILLILQGREGVMRRLVNVPEGMPSVMVAERLMAQPLLTGPVAVPAEGSVLPDSYDFRRGEARSAVLARMQAAMTTTLARLWAERGPDTVATTPQEAVILASIVEKETGKPSERKMVAGLYSNRLRKGMRLQADPTIIYPITKGKPLGRRILASEIHARNDYNTYTMAGLPKGPITNPGRLSIEAVLHPAQTKALYMVADGKGGHVFADTLEQHNANVAKWFALRRSRGEL